MAIAARRAVARPVAGTILTVADAAADAAEDALATQAGDALAVARAAQRGGREALARTPQQLDVLAAAGVVDAGGQAYTLMVDVLVEVLGGEPAQPLSAVDPAEVRRSGPIERPPVEFEVMYAVRGATRPISTNCAKNCQRSAIASSSWVTRRWRRSTCTSATRAPRWRPPCLGAG